MELFKGERLKWKFYNWQEKLRHFIEIYSFIQQVFTEHLLVREKQKNYSYMTAICKVYHRGILLRK